MCAVGHLSARVSASVLALSLLTSSAAAQIFSPGELAKPHEKLEGLQNCTECHEAGKKLSNALCLDCHKEIAPTLVAKKGLHGQPKVRDKSCASCHHDHLGREHEMIDWQGDPKRFEHERAGYALRGKHAKVECKACHDMRLVQDAEVRKLVERTKRRTYLGLPTDCAGCHFDEHRGQLEERCESCHDEKDWKHTPSFDHGEDTDYPLLGKHEKVKCEECHPRQTDRKTQPGVFPAPVSMTFAKLDDLAHGTCLDCHADVHDGKLGRDCSSCHVVQGWKVLARGAKDTGFHDDTRFPLRGGHVGVACKACHGPSRGRAAVFKDMPFESCAFCHEDAHAGQLGETKGGAGETCDRCHTVESFMPVTFGAAEHDETDYPLRGAHRVVACDRCHPADKKLEGRFSASLRRKLADYGRKPRLSLARFQLDEPTERCESCHEDFHDGQFTEHDGARSCSECHTVATFHELRFDHDASRFPLTGRHREVACDDCHPVSILPGARDETVIYRPVATECSACHVDVHVAQLRRAGEESTDCARCHDTKAFTPASFDHDDPRLSRFALEGKHDEARCDTCHTKIQVDAKTAVTRYKPLPLRCGECHADFHRGAYSGPRIGELVAAVTKTAAGKAESGSSCETCHTAHGWSRVRFAAHDATAFPLAGEHAAAPCAACHSAGYEKQLLHDCTSCHRDPHAGELGGRCESCHTAEGWRGAFDALAHRRSRFPLFGRHALVPCQECHPAGARGFGLATLECIDCHAADYARTALATIDHAAAGFSTDCSSCHDAWSFTPGRFPEHDRCFAITSGPHRGIGCRDCHSSLSSFAVTGACGTNTAACSACHEHRCADMDAEHRRVPGYECRDQKCYACHRFSAP